MAEIMNQLEDQQLYQEFKKSKNIKIIKINKVFFEEACVDGDLEAIIYILSENKNINPEINMFKALLFSCCLGHLNVVKYLLENSTKICEEKIDIHLYNENLFTEACRNCHLDVVKYLWEYSKYKIDVHVDEDQPIKHAYMMQNTTILNYLLCIGVYNSGIMNMIINNTGVSFDISGFAVIKKS